MAREMGVEYAGASTIERRWSAPTVTASFEAQFTELFGLAYRIAYRIVGSREDATDIAQEALARAEQRWGRLADQPHAWVARVASNLAIGYWRKARRPSPAPIQPVAATDTERIDLVRALKALPRRQREVVVLRYLADRPEAEVAALLRCSTGAVKTHASRGLAALRARLDPTGA